MLSRSHLTKAFSTGLLLALPLITIGCGDVYRPVALPIPGSPPSPGAAHFVVAVQNNGKIDTGTASQINVSGDTNSGVFQTGLTPVHASLIPNGTRVYVANLGDDTVTANAPSSPTSASTISLPQGAQPVFVHSAENNNVYVANYGNSTVSVINANSNVVTTNVAVGTNPVALAEMPTSGSTTQKLYVGSLGTNFVSLINVVDDSLGTAVNVGAPQVWAVARADGQRIYVLTTNGTVSAINTLTDTVMTNSASPSAGAGANFMFLDATAQRLYVTNPNPSVHSLSIFDISEVNPAMPVNPVATLDLGQSASPAFLPISVTGIGDGSRAYIATYQLTACAATSGNFPCMNSAVAVINVGNNTVSKFVPVASGVPVDATNSDGCGGTTLPGASPWTPSNGARFRLSATASGGGSTSNKVYVSQCDAQNIAVIDTFPANGNPPDVFAGVTVPAPLSASPGVQVGISAASQSSTTTTYTYTQSSGASLQVGESIFVTGMSDTSNNGSFVITGGNLVASGSGTFTVTNSFGVTTTAAQTGTGTFLPRQNPVFMVAGP
jgi:YVTN family beta-propeller protein